MPCPKLSMTSSIAPNRLRTARSVSTSSETLNPLIASSDPPGNNNGRHHVASSLNRATARAVTRLAQNPPELFGASSVDSDVRQAQLVNRHGHPVGSSQHRLHEMKVKVRTRNGQGEPG